MSSPARIAVVGGGIAALTAADRLARSGYAVDVFDKARGPGGRTSVRRTDIRERQVAFPHGSTLFVVAGDDFRQVVEEWQRLGVVEPYRGQIVRMADVGRARFDHRPHFVGDPAMNAMAKHLAATPGITFHAQHPVATVADGLVKLSDGTTRDGFAGVVVACPAPQAAVLLKDAAPDLADRAASVSMRPTWAVMVAWEGDDTADFDAARPATGDLSWLFKAAEGAWVVHFDHTFSERHLERPAEEVAGEAVRQASMLLRRNAPPIHVAAHRWRYVAATNPVGEACLATPSRTVLVCGDWLLGDGVEHAWRSGDAAATRLLEALKSSV